MPRSRSSGLTRSSDSFEVSLSRNGLMAGSLQNWLCRLLLQWSRTLAKSGAVTRMSVSSGRSLSGEGITAWVLREKAVRERARTPRHNRRGERQFLMGEVLDGTPRAGGVRALVAGGPL